MPFKKKGGRAKGKATKDQGKPSKDGDTSPGSTSRSSFEEDFVNPLQERPEPEPEEKPEPPANNAPDDVEAALPPEVKAAAGGAPEQPERLELQNTPLPTRQEIAQSDVEAGLPLVTEPEPEPTTPVRPKAPRSGKLGTMKLRSLKSLGEESPAAGFSPRQLLSSVGEMMSPKDLLKSTDSVDSDEGEEAHVEHEMTDEELRHITKAFEACDVNKNGSIDPEELTAMMGVLGADVTLLQVQQVMQKNRIAYDKWCSEQETGSNPNLRLSQGSYLMSEVGRSASKDQGSPADREAAVASRMFERLNKDGVVTAEQLRKGIAEGALVPAGGGDSASVSSTTAPLMSSPAASSPHSLSADRDGRSGGRSHQRPDHRGARHRPGRRAEVAGVPGMGV